LDDMNEKGRTVSDLSRAELIDLYILCNGVIIDLTTLMSVMMRKADGAPLSIN
jgi:hypothetical protein